MEIDYELKTKQSLHINLLLRFLGVGRSPIQDNISMCIHDIRAQSLFLALGALVRPSVNS